MASKREPMSRIASSTFRSSSSNSTAARTRNPTRTSAIRQPLSASTSISRINRERAVSPAASISSVATSGAKRKEREFESDGPGEATHINVVVRCRGRNEREVKENGAVVVSAPDGVKGKNVELVLGPNAFGNKTYDFDRVFSPAADQSMVFNDIVKPILDQVRSRFYLHVDSHVPVPVPACRLALGVISR